MAPTTFEELTADDVESLRIIVSNYERAQRRFFGVRRGRWIAHFWFVGWGHLSAGFHIYLPAPNIEIHVPFGFFRIGRTDRQHEELRQLIDEARAVLAVVDAAQTSKEASNG